MQKKYDIGDVQDYKESRHLKLVGEFNQLIPLVNIYISAVETLTGEKISQEQFEHSMSQGLDKIKETYSQVVNKQSAGLGTVGIILKNALQEGINAAMKDLEAKRQSAIKTLDGFRMSNFSENIDWNQILIQDGIATFDHEAAKENYITRISNPAQIEFLEEKEKFKAALSRMVESMKKSGYQISVWQVVGPDGFFEIGQDGTFYDNPDMISCIKQPEALKSVELL